MSLWSWITSWFRPAAEDSAPPAADGRPEGLNPSAAPTVPRPRRPRSRKRGHIRLQALDWQPERTPRDAGDRQYTVLQKPYAFARPSIFGGFLDLSRDGDDERLRAAGLPRFNTPQQLAAWLSIPLGRLAWLVHRFDERQRPAEPAQSHYHYQWLRKRSGGERLIEIPKPKLRLAQQRILREILDKVPLHAAAHGFAARRSIRTNAAPHVGQRVVMKFDLEGFYPSVRFSRVVAIFRSLGYSREAAIWLGRLTTSDAPWSAHARTHTPEGSRWLPYCVRHLPQGACTSPALANLSAYILDLRLSGLARKFNARYTRYADDLTFSGDEVFLRSLAVFIPLVQKIVKSETFKVNLKKRKVLRNSQRQTVAGVVVNSRPNVSREDFDALKATLVNCVRRGPSTQNHQRHPDFAMHLRGRIAHVSHLHPPRGARLLALFQRIDWTR